MHLERKSWWDVFLSYGGGLVLGAAGLYAALYAVGYLTEAAYERIKDFFRDQRSDIQSNLAEARALGQDTSRYEQQIAEIDQAVRDVEREPRQKSAPPGAHMIYR